MSSSNLEVKFRFSTPSGHQFCRDILASRLPYHPHDFQIEGICKTLDGIDLMALTATGSGKTTFYTGYMMVLLAIQEDSSLCPTARFPVKKDPVLVIVCPTKALQFDMELKMLKLGLAAKAINGDTINEAQRRGEELWATVRNKDNIINVILVSPERLNTEGFADALKDKSWWNRICALGVDEVHLLNTWGMSFRKDFVQIGFFKARFPSWVPWIMTSASVRVDGAMDSICSFLGLNAGSFHLIKRSNARHDVQILFRELQSGIDGCAFPELLWILDSGRTSLIFAPTIHLGFRLGAYLYRNASHYPDRDQRIRLYNSLNWASYNEQTRQMLSQPDPTCKIGIGTDALSVGVDMPAIHDVVIILESGAIENKDVDDYVQKMGRVGRDRKLVSDPRVIVYSSKATISSAQKAVDSADSQKDASPKSTLSMARMLIAPCKVLEQNRQYGNPDTDPACLCCGCLDNPPAPPRLTCNCSGCIPETNIAAIVKGSRSAATHAFDVPARKKLTKLMQEHGIRRFEEFRNRVWMAADERTSGWVPRSAYFPDPLIKSFLDCLAAISTTEHVSTLASGNPYLKNYHSAILDLVEDLGPEMELIREAAALDRKMKKAEKDAAKTVEAACIGNSEEEDEEEVCEDEQLSSELRSGIVWKLRFGKVLSTNSVTPNTVSNSVPIGSRVTQTVASNKENVPLSKQRSLLAK